MKKDALKVLFATSEAYPLIKTGGLADVSSGLPQAISGLGHDIRVILPAYKQIIDGWDCTEVCRHNIDGHQIRILSTQVENTNASIWLLDIPELYYRNGGPYGTPDGHDWPDNAERFSIFSKVICEIAMDRLSLDWRPDVVHCNDWQTGLAPAYLSREKTRPSTVFTIHNLAYLGLFPQQKFTQLDLPSHWWAWNMLEFHHHFSFIKGGLVFADQINTVSPTYAEEIKMPAFGYGMEGLLNYRSHLLSGILNGVDYQQWSPETDKLIPKNYSLATIKDKKINKQALQKHFALPEKDDVMLIGVVGRMVEQKGYDLILHALNEMSEQHIQIVMLGSGESHLENALLNTMDDHPEKISIIIGYDEEIAHLIEAGSDMFMMPSRFEPCGLNQFYSLKYGTIPFVNNTGGLADSVIDASQENIKNGSATGFKMTGSSYESFISTFHYAVEIFFQNPQNWQKISQNGMKQDFSWEKSAKKYISLYQKSIESQYHIPSSFSV